MTYPLTYKDNGVLKIMNTTELGTLAQQVLEYMAVNDGPGLLSLSNVSGTYTVIGTFTDTAFESNIGGGNTQVNSNVITIYQDLTTPSGDEPPRFFKYNTGDAPVKLSSDSEIDDLANLILTWGLTNEGPHSFVIEETTPSDGGTWSDLGSLTEIYAGELTNSKKLFKKLSSGAYTLNRPLKTGGQGILQKFNDTDINNLAKKVRERIVNTGIGTYLFQAATPSPGTWVSKGSINDTRATANPTNYQSDTPYLGTDTYTGPAPAGYTGQVDTIYSGDQYTNTYQGTYENFLAYTLTNSYETDYTNFTAYTLTLSFDQFYTNFVGYSTDYQTNYTIAYQNFTIFDGAIFSSVYETIYTVPNLYTGLTDFTNFTTVYTGTNVSTFEDRYVVGLPYSGPLEKDYLGLSTTYTRNSTRYYTRVDTYNYFLRYTGPQSLYDLLYNSTVNLYTQETSPLSFYTQTSFNGYVGPAIRYTGPSFYNSATARYASYTGPGGYNIEYTNDIYQIDGFTINYQSVEIVDYTGAYATRNLFYEGFQRPAAEYEGPGNVYDGKYFIFPSINANLRDYISGVGGFISVQSYLGPLTTLFFNNLYTSTNVNAGFFDGISYLGPAGYINLYTTGYVSSYTVSTYFENFFARDYENIYNLSLLYTTTYDRDVLYSSTDLYERSFTADLLYSSSVTYEGPSFQTIYDATGNPGTLYTLEAFPVYTAILPDTGSYVNENAIPYTVDYEGLLVEDTPQTISTITLWRRVA